MLNAAIFAFLHHVAFVALFVTLTIEVVLFERELGVDRARRILRADAIYGLSAMALLGIGFIRVLFFEKGTAYYFSNIFFWTKLALFIAVGLLSIYPTIRFLKWRPNLRLSLAPNMSERECVLIKRILHVELIGLALMLLCAALMARGIG